MTLSPPVRTVPKRSLTLRNSDRRRSKRSVLTQRETFAICALSDSHNVEYGKEQGDFKVDSRYTFEIGGRNKTFSQIAGVEDSYIFADDWDMPDGAKLPLWMLGFLY